MALGNLNFDKISLGDLEELINNGVPEGLNIEYKRDLYGSSDSDKREALKDISSFGNSFGGHLIIGMTAIDGIPKELTGLQNDIPDIAIQRLENLARDGIEPRITGIRIKTISLEPGRYVILIRIPRSWNPPHRVRANNVNRFYVRNSAGAHEGSVEELRSLFNLSGTIHDRVISFRKERLSILSANEGPKKIESGGRLILHIIPFSAFSYKQSLDVKEIYKNQLLFRPMYSGSHTQIFNFDGVLNFRGGERCHGYTQIFRNGIIEATMADLLITREGSLFIPSLGFDECIFGRLPTYLEGLKMLNVPPPIVIMISLQEIHGASLGIGTIRDFGSPNKFTQSELLLPEIILDDYGSLQEYQKAMRPAFDALWNAAGYADSRYFDENDNWIGERR